MVETKTLAYVVYVTTENGTVINTTENHPFYVEGKGWCAAADLEDEDALRTQDGETETVEDVQIEQLDEPAKLYNLEIEDSHTYYVSADGVLVYNMCRNPNGRNGGEKHQTKIEAKAKSFGDNAKKEFAFPYTDKNGKQKNRYADVVKVVNNIVTEVCQVGCSNNNGTPVIRERCEYEFKNGKTMHWTSSQQAVDLIKSGYKIGL